MAAYAPVGQPQYVLISDDEDDHIAKTVPFTNTKDEAIEFSDDEEVSNKKIPSEGNGGTAVSGLGKHKCDDYDHKDDKQPKKQVMEDEHKPKPQVVLAPKAKAKVVPAFSAGQWHHDVDVLFKKLEEDAKLNRDKLDDMTLDVLKPLPYEVALLCLGKVRDEKPVIRNMNAFIVKNAAHLRNQWGLDDAASSSSSSSSEDEDEDV